MPDRIRERIRAARTVRASAKVTPELVQRVLDQPGARTINATLTAGGTAMVMLGPAAAWAGTELYWAGRLDALTTVALLLVLAAVFGTLYALLALLLVRRRAVALVALRLGATPAVGASGAHTCRSCSAALPAAARGIVVACEYCKAPNILGLDLRAEAAAADSQEEELETDLYTAELHRTRALRRLWLALAGVAASAGLLASSLVS